MIYNLHHFFQIAMESPQLWKFHQKRWWTAIWQKTLQTILKIRRKGGEECVV